MGTEKPDIHSTLFTIDHRNRLNSEVFRAVLIESHAACLGEYKFFVAHKRLLVKSKKTGYGARKAAIEAAKRFWAIILWKARIYYEGHDFFKSHKGPQKLTKNYKSLNS